MSHTVCPVWLGHVLASPLRKLLHCPQKILAPYVRPGMLALDVGSGMGFFTLPLARLVGPAGKVIAVDLQQGMLDGLNRRAQAKGLHQQIECRLCQAVALGLDQYAGQVDFALLFAVAHEAPNQQTLFEEISAALKNDGKLLLAEPKGHVKLADFEQTLDAAREQGFKQLTAPRIPRSLTALLGKEPI